MKELVKTSQQVSRNISANLILFLVSVSMYICRLSVGSSGSTPSHHSDQKYSYDQVNDDKIVNMLHVAIANRK